MVGEDTWVCVLQHVDVSETFVFRWFLCSPTESRQHSVRGSWSPQQSWSDTTALPRVHQSNLYSRPTVQVDMGLYPRNTEFSREHNLNLLSESLWERAIYSLPNSPGPEHWPITSVYLIYKSGVELTPTELISTLFEGLYSFTISRVKWTFSK